MENWSEWKRSLPREKLTKEQVEVLLEFTQKVVHRCLTLILCMDRLGRYRQVLNIFNFFIKYGIKKE